MRTNRFGSRVWTVLLIAVGVALLAGAAIHTRHHVHGPPPPPSHGARARDPNRIASWMTLRYVSRAYAVPEPVLLRALQLGPQQANRHTLAGLASQKGVGTQTVLTELRVAIRQYRAANPQRSTPTPRPAP